MVSCKMFDLYFFEQFVMFVGVWGDVLNYVQDCVQCSFFFFDILFDCGNDYLEYLEQGMLLFLKFDYELVLDGYGLLQFCNYVLLCL